MYPFMLMCETKQFRLSALFKEANTMANIGGPNGTRTHDPRILSRAPKPLLYISSRSTYTGFPALICDTGRDRAIWTFTFSSSIYLHTLCAKRYSYGENATFAWRESDINITFLYTIVTRVLSLRVTRMLSYECRHTNVAI